MEKPKAKIPFPTIAQGKEEPKPEVAQELAAQQESVTAEAIQHMQENTLCKHEVNLKILAKNGQLYCGHCRKAMFLPNIAQWIPLDREIPLEWDA